MKSLSNVLDDAIYKGSIIFGVGGITHTFLIAINIETKKET